MENVNTNEKFNINDEQLEDVSGGAPGLLGSIPCDICGNRVPKGTLVEYHLRRICRLCQAKVNSK